MKNKLLLIGAIGFMTIISAHAFSQNAAGGQPVPNKIIQPTSVKNQAVKPATTVQSAHSVSIASQPVPGKIIQPSSLAGNKAAIKASPATHSASIAKQPVPSKIIQPASLGVKNQATQSAVPVVNQKALSITTVNKVPQN